MAAPSRICTKTCTTYEDHNLAKLIIRKILLFLGYLFSCCFWCSPIEGAVDFKYFVVNQFRNRKC